MMLHPDYGLLEETYRAWTEGRGPREARLYIFEKIRDIPYAVIPEINGALEYARILSIGRGSCTPKHFLLREFLGRLGIPVLFVVYPFHWGDVEVDYPPHLRDLARAVPVSYHLACKVELQGKLVFVDATVDAPLKRLGLPVNEEWDGFSDMALPVTPAGDEEVYHPSEVRDYRASYPDASLQFFREMNAWLDRVRQTWL